MVRLNTFLSPLTLAALVALFSSPSYAHDGTLARQTATLIVADSNPASPDHPSTSAAVKSDHEDDEEEEEEDDEEYEDRSAMRAKVVDPHTAAMLALAKKSGCLACHKLESKLVGPGWNDVAERYRNDAAARTRLIDKVSKGGGGNWTEVTGGSRMPPYGQKVAPENIATLVDFILSLKP